MSWSSEYLGDYGYTKTITFLDEDGSALDISTYTTKSFILVPPDNVRKSITAAFDSDGTDGVLTYTFADGDVHIPGDWTVFARVIKTGAQKTSDPFTWTILAKP